MRDAGLFNVTRSVFFHSKSEQFWGGQLRSSNILRVNSPTVFWRKDGCVMPDNSPPLGVDSSNVSLCLFLTDVPFN